MSTHPRVSLSEVADFYSGGTPSKANASFWIGSIPWVSPKDMGADEIDRAEDSISEEAVAASATRVVPSGTILAVTRSGILARKFPLALTRCPVAFNQDIRAIRPKNGSLSARYLFHFLRAKEPDVLHSGVKKGATVHSLVSGYLERLSIPLPPIEEQRRIAAALDRATRLVTLHKQAVAKTSDLIPALFFQMFGDPVRDDVVRLPLGQVAEVVSGLTKGRKLSGKAVQPTPYLRVANVQAGHLDLSEIKTIEATEDEVRQLSLRPGDVLLTEGGDHDKLGRGALWRGEINGCVHQNHVFRVRCDASQLAPVYFDKFLLTHEAKGYFLRAAKRTTNLASINMTQLRALPVPLPPPEEQQRFGEAVATIEDALAETRRATDAASALKNSLLDEVFGGSR